jgi:hypothetical protein
MRVQCAALLCAAFVSIGCGGPLVVAARVVRPATLAVRAFPQIYVVSEDDPDSRTVADRLATHLAERPGPGSARPQVRRTSRRRLAAWRASGDVARVSVVLLVEVTVEEDQRPDFNSRPSPVCGPGGCYLATRAFAADIPTLRARAQLRVEDGPTGRSLQQTSIDARDEGSDPLSMRGRAVLELAERAAALVDGGVRALEVALVEVDDAPTRRALALIERGQWGRGATLLARIVSAPSFARRARGDRAAILFDLGQALRFSGPEDAAAIPRLESALASLRAALRVDPQALYAEALRDLERQKRDLALSTEQRAATAHNFALAQDAPPALPSVPPGYRDSPDAGPAP